MTVHPLDIILFLVLVSVFWMVYPDVKERINIKTYKKFKKPYIGKNRRRKKKWGRTKRTKGLKRHNGKLIK